MSVEIIQGDALAVLQGLPSESVHSCVCSPPYWGLRSYLSDDDPSKRFEMGSEEMPEEWCARLVEVFREVKRVLRKDGTLWLNVGDSYCSSDKWGGGTNGNSGKHSVADDGSVPSWACRDKRPRIEGVKPKDLIGQPWLLAFALRADGWYLRSDVYRLSSAAYLSDYLE